DLVDPMWPDDVLDQIAAELRGVPDRYGLTIHSAFIGLAHYTYNQLLHPRFPVRDAAETWLERAYRFAAAAGIPRVGGPLGAVAARRDGTEPDSIAEADYADLIERMGRLARAAKKHGLAELYVEPTPLRREWPWTPDQARRMLADLTASEVPWKLCVDWGHALFEPVYGGYRARMEPWIEALGGEIGVFHIQQTDGRYDRHWDFTEAGAVDPVAAASLLRRHGLADRPVFLEVFYPFERDDRSVLDAVKSSATALRSAFS
ncbi:MAG TPA: TIM barrel protein, partial [Bauldia sp.]|nr:TIM barrel protein [Bauldia sp.]